MVGRCRDAARSHFKTGEPRAFGHEFWAHELAFSRPDLFGEPIHQRKIGTQSADEVHGCV